MSVCWVRNTCSKPSKFLCFLVEIFTSAFFLNYIFNIPSSENWSISLSKLDWFRSSFPVAEDFILSNVELSSGNHSRRGFEKALPGGIYHKNWWCDGAISWWCFMGIESIVPRNGPCTTHLKFSIGLLLWKHGAWQLSGLFGDFRVWANFGSWILQVLTSKGTQCGESRMVPAWDFAELLCKRSVSRGISIWNTHWKSPVEGKWTQQSQELKKVALGLSRSWQILETHGGFLKWGSPWIIHFNGIFHCKPTILGYHQFRKPRHVQFVFLPLTFTLNQRRSRSEEWRRYFPGLFGRPKFAQSADAATGPRFWEWLLCSAVAWRYTAAQRQLSVEHLSAWGPEPLGLSRSFWPESDAPGRSPGATGWAGCPRRPQEGLQDARTARRSASSVPAGGEAFGDPYPGGGNEQDHQDHQENTSHMMRFQTAACLLLSLTH